MSVPLTLLILFAAALLEAGGDALVRHGLLATSGVVRFLFFLLGASVLFLYGYVVNSPPLKFGDLIGVYVVFFFVTAQLISYFAFGETPSKTLLLGGACILVGGAIISFGNQP